MGLTGEQIMACLIGIYFSCIMKRLFCGSVCIFYDSETGLFFLTFSFQRINMCVVISGLLEVFFFPFVCTTFY